MTTYDHFRSVVSGFWSWMHVLVSFMQGNMGPFGLDSCHKLATKALRMAQ